MVDEINTTESFEKPVDPRTLSDGELLSKAIDVPACDIGTPIHPLGSLLKYYRSDSKQTVIYEANGKGIPHSEIRIITDR